MIRYAEKRVVDSARGKGRRRRRRRRSRKSDRMSTTNLSAILREFFPRQRAITAKQRKAAELCDYIPL
jgi:hypothetical protein